MDNHANNPAGRLWLYFSYIVTKTASDPVRRHANAYFGYPDGLSDKFLVTMAAMMKLPDEVEELLAQIDDTVVPLEKLKRPLAAVRPILEGDPTGSNQVSWAASSVTPAVLSELETTSTILNRFATRGSAISDDVIAQIKLLAAQIIVLAQDDDTLDPVTRAAFIRYGHRITEAADLYKAAGTQPLVDELDRFHWQMARLKPSKGLWEKTKELTGVVLLAVELFTAPVTIADAASHYIEAFSPRASIEAPAQQTPHVSAVEDDGTVVEAEIMEDDATEESSAQL